MEQPALGLALAFTAGVLFGLNGALIRAGSRNVSTTLSVLISLALGTPLLLGAAVLSGQLLSLPLEGWAAYFAAGILSFVVGRGLYYYSITLLGATSASIIRASSSSTTAGGYWPSIGNGSELNTRSRAPGGAAAGEKLAAHGG